MNDRIRGMKDALHIAEQCTMKSAEHLSPVHAAEAMSEIIQGALRAHIRAAEATELDKDNLPG